MFWFTPTSTSPVRDLASVSVFSFLPQQFHSRLGNKFLKKNKQHSPHIQILLMFEKREKLCIYAWKKNSESDVNSLIIRNRRIFVLLCDGVSSTTLLSIFNPYSAVVGLNTWDKMIILTKLEKCWNLPYSTTQCKIDYHACTFSQWTLLCKNFFYDLLISETKI